MPTFSANSRCVIPRFILNSFNPLALLLTWISGHCRPLRRCETIPRVLNRSATPCLGLEVFEVSNSRRCRTHGPTVFASVVRGEDPDREAALRTASGHPSDRGEDRPGQVHREPRAEARPVVRVQRERIVPALPAETAEDRAVDLGSVPFGTGRAEEGRQASERIPQAAPHGLGPVARLGA